MLVTDKHDEAISKRRFEMMQSIELTLASSRIK